MDPKEHDETTQRKHEEKKSRSPYRCDNCGETFTSLSLKRAHERQSHGAESSGEKTKTAGSKSEQE